MEIETDRLLRAAVDRMVRVAEATERLHDRVATMERQLAVLVDNVKDTERAAHDAKAQAVATREETGRFRTQQPEHKSGKFWALGRDALRLNWKAVLSWAALLAVATVAVPVAVAVYEHMRSVLGAH